MTRNEWRLDYYQRNREKIIAQTIARRNKRSPEQKLWDNARERASKNGREFNIEIKDIIIPDICPVLGIPMNSPSLDRIENALGYIKGNIEVISKRANWLKRDATREELNRICRYYFSEGT